MAVCKDITSGLQTLSAVGAVAGVFDTSGLSAPFEVKIQIPSFTGTSCTIALESSVLGSFTDAIAVFAADFGNVCAAAEQWLSVPWYNLAGAAYGSANNKFRLRVSAMSAGVLQIRAMIAQ
jgi:hypothetical protein